jgi:hypothetical protein
VAFQCDTDTRAHFTVRMAFLTPPPATERFKLQVGLMAPPCLVTSSSLALADKLTKTNVQILTSVDFQTIFFLFFVEMESYP